MKTCRICHESKDHNAFSPWKKSADGLKAICKSCRAAQERQRRINKPELFQASYQRNRDTLRARRRDYYAEHVEQQRQASRDYYAANRDAALAREREWKAKNPERCKELSRLSQARPHVKAHNQEYRKAWREANQERFRASIKRWEAEHPETMQVVRVAVKARRRARERAGGSFSHQEWTALKTQYDYTCLVCGKSEPEIKLTPDHVLPLAVGGMNTIDNIQPMCRPCNIRKAAKHIDYREATNGSSLRAV